MIISIIIPAYNEEKRIGDTLEEYGKFFNKLKIGEKIRDFEILVIINNTTDNTENLVKEAIITCPEIRYLNLKPGGKGFAIIEGFKDALTRDNNLIGFVDADMSTKPEAYYELVKNIGEFDGIIASRRMKESVIEKSLNRSIISFTFNFIVRMILWLPYKDTQCGAKLFKKPAVDLIINDLTEKGWIIDLDLLFQLKKKKLKVKEYEKLIELHKLFCK